MTCRAKHLDLVAAYSADTTKNATEIATYSKEHCVHAAEKNSTTCPITLAAAPVKDSAAYSVSTYSFAALVMALIVASAQL